MKITSFTLLGLLAANASLAGALDKCPRDRGTTVVRFAYGSEKEDWIKAATTEFNAQKAKSHDKTVCVEAFAEGSGDMVSEVLTMNDDVAPEREVDAISPASALYLEVGNSQYQQAQGKDIFENKNSLVRSQVVIAMWDPVVQSFGRPAEQIGWRDVMERATKDPKFRFGQTHPAKSNSGLAALVAQFYAGAEAKLGRLRGLSMDNVNDPDIQKFVKDVQQTVVHYGESTGFYANTMLQDGPSNLSAAVLYENLVIADNRKINEDPKYQGLPRLRAVYPSEGTFVTDHPFAFVRRAWVTDEKFDAANVYRQFLMTPEIQLKAVQYGFKPGLNDLQVPAELIAQNWSEQFGVAGYDERNKILKAPQGNVIAAVQQLWASQLKKSSHVLVVIDRSGSMDGRRIEGARRGASQVVRTMNERDLFSLLIFDDQMEYEPGRDQPPLTMNGAGKDEALRNIAQIRARGGTAMYDALLDGYNYLCGEQKTAAAKGEPPRIYAIFALTDGEDNQSKQSLDSVIAGVGFTGAALQARAPQEKGFFSRLFSGDAPATPPKPECKIPIFGITYGDKDSSYTENLRLISSSTGGSINSSENPMAIEEFFRALSSFL